mmetsp:Transcript_25600/g.39382  ORF Transcript_25600/g.39382 Transcript_25600/m.39382 type:complete len:107 (-) Transcript_25600:1068-1388(-)
MDEAEELELSGDGGLANEVIRVMPLYRSWGKNRIAISLKGKSSTDLDGLDLLKLRIFQQEAVLPIYDESGHLASLNDPASHFQGEVDSTLVATAFGQKLKIGAQSF